VGLAIVSSLPIAPQSLIRCSTLACSLRAQICVVRQLASDRQRTHDTWRGIASEYPSCRTDRCAQGKAVREALEASATGSRRAWAGEGPGGRWLPLRSDLAEQHAARERLASVGLLRDVPSFDEPPSEASESAAA
jgi:hypothetical protein